MENHGFPEIFYTSAAKGKRERGRPMKRWIDQFWELETESLILELMMMMIF
jgi:hypothetical protein